MGKLNKAKAIKIAKKGNLTKASEVFTLKMS